MISEKIQIQKYKEINKATKSVRNPHILRTLPILHLIEVFKTFLALHIACILFK